MFGLLVSSYLFLGVFLYYFLSIIGNSEEKKNSLQMQGGIGNLFTYEKRLR